MSKIIKSYCGDNKNHTHKMKYLEDAPDVVVAYCENCKRRFYFRKCDGRTDPAYSKVFKRDTLQRHENLYYKYYGQMNIVGI